jgi:hypothetical protein
VQQKRQGRPLPFLRAQRRITSWRAQQQERQLGRQQVRRHQQERRHQQAFAQWQLGQQRVQQQAQLALFGHMRQGQQPTVLQRGSTWSFQFLEQLVRFLGMVLHDNNVLDTDGNHSLFFIGFVCLPRLNSSKPR